MLVSLSRTHRITTQLLPRASYLHTTALLRQATAEPTPAPTRKPSSVPKGTVLKGIHYFKEGKEPVALEDSEYPDWLWDLLDEKKQKQKSSKPTFRQYHRKQSRDAIKAMNFMKDKKN
ncbi:hypothetical protein K501DRAFT_226843 [Backusella circina FSU 941]|nr:hypothetical protein K501DRAFT_226843 [Backusella circina FSU 941]